MKKLLLIMLIAIPGIVSSQTIKCYSVDNKGTAILMKQKEAGVDNYYLSFKDYIVELGDSASCVNILNSIINEKYIMRKPFALNNSNRDSSMYWNDYGIMSYFFLNGSKKSPYITQNQIKEMI